MTTLSAAETATEGDAMSKWRVSLVMPAFNESEGIATSATEALAALARFTDDHELIIVDDGSSDATTDAVLGLRSSKVRLIRHPVNRGYGAALQTGFRASRFDRIAFTDADGQFHLDDLARLVSLSDQTPIVVGYRMDRQDPWKRRFYSWGYNVLTRTLLKTGVRDCDCALKVFRREVLETLLPQTNGFFVNTEMLSNARRAGIPIMEVGVRHRPRRSGVSKVSIGDIPKTLRVLIPYWWRVAMKKA